MPFWIQIINRNVGDGYICADLQDKTGNTCREPMEGMARVYNVCMMRSATD